MINKTKSSLIAALFIGCAAYKLIKMHKPEIRLDLTRLNNAAESLKDISGFDIESLIKKAVEENIHIESE